MKKTRKNKEKFTETLLMCLCAVIFCQYLEALWNFKRIQKRHTGIRSDQPAEDLSDLITIFYGHNMKNGSMFGSLKKLRRDEKAKKQPCSTWIKIFSTRITSAVRVHTV